MCKVAEHGVQHERLGNMKRDKTAYKTRPMCSEIQQLLVSCPESTAEGNQVDCALCNVYLTMVLCRRLTIGGAHRVSCITS